MKPDKTTQDALLRISKARATLILDYPFFASLALRLGAHADPSCPSIGVDGKKMYFNPEWVCGRTPEDMLTIVAHEAMHCGLLHPLRRGNRDPDRANIAMDHAVNLILKSAGFHMPKDAYCDPQFAGMSWEAIYQHIPENPKGPGKSGYGGMGTCDDATEDGKRLSEAEQTAQENEWQVAVLQAAQAAKAQGKLPGALAGLIEGIRSPKVDWRTVLREFVRQIAANDYSWRRPNMRHIASGDYFPSLFDEVIGSVLKGVDTSGSVSDDELQIVCSELNAILETVKPESVDVVYCDSRVAGHERFTPENYPVKMAVKGRGGTNLRGIWKYAEEHEIEPVCAILTTDMELCVADLGEEPDYPVLILSTGRAAPMDGPLPFGTLVQVEL